MIPDSNKPRPPQKPAPPPEIRIMEAMVEGYAFLKDNFTLLFKAALVPMLVGFVTHAILGALDTSPGYYMSFVLTLPVTVVFAWYVFVQTRLQVFDEVYIRLPADQDLRAERGRALTISLSCYILFQMGLALASQFIMLGFGTGEGSDTPRPGQLVIIFMGLTVMIWGVKFSVIHLVAAVEGDLKDYINRVRGFWFSFVLIGLGFVAIVPILLVFVFVFGALLQDPENMTALSRNMFYLVGTIMSWAVIAALNATAVSALKQLYQNKKRTFGS